MFVRSLVLLSVAISFSATAADSAVVEKPLVGQTLEAFNTEAAKIRAEMQPGGAYEFIKPVDRQRVDSDLATMGKILSDHAQGSDLKAGDKIKLANAQEDANGILKHNDANRLVCERVEPIGSHVPVTTCRTYGEVERRRHNDQKSLNDMNRSDHVGANSKEQVKVN